MELGFLQHMWQGTKTVKRGFKVLIFGAQYQFDPVQIGKSTILKVRGQGDEPLVYEWVKTQQGQTAGFENMAGGENLEMFCLSIAFPGRDHQIVVHFGASF